MLCSRPDDCFGFGNKPSLEGHVSQRRLRIPISVPVSLQNIDVLVANQVAG